MRVQTSTHRVLGVVTLERFDTHKSYSVSEWIRSMLNTYYRAHDILIPNPEELKLGDTRKFVTGALTIAPESGTYFNMHVLDFVLAFFCRIA